MTNETKETWETISENERPSGKTCVRYYPKRICIKMAETNVSKKFCILAQSLISKEDIDKALLEQGDPNTLTDVNLCFYADLQLSSTKKRIRFVFSKHNNGNDNVIEVVCGAKEKQKWDDFSVRMVYHYTELSISNLLTFNAKLECEQVVFVDASDKPTKSPMFEIEDVDGKIIVTGNIKGITQKEFLEAFPSAKEKKKKEAEKK